ncbi:MAG TPA: hypothetical protein VFQ23_01740 [Anaerolineales bacterium]|nr:hypothetical protein [Anaerolineales bacterium]
MKTKPPVNDRGLINQITLTCKLIQVREKESPGLSGIWNDEQDDEYVRSWYSLFGSIPM